MSGQVLAVDIGGTKIAAAVVDRTGRVLREAVRPTAAPVFDALRGAVLELGPGPVAAVGLSCAGPVDAMAGTVGPINIPTWRDFPLRERVGELVPDVPIALAGDGQCMALGEHWLGAGRGSDAMLGMVVSTGVGGGLVLGGRPFVGGSGNAGHVGHVVAEPAGDTCGCGGRGCVETVASGPNLVRWAIRNGWTGAPTDYRATTGVDRADVDRLEVDQLEVERLETDHLETDRPEVDRTDAERPHVDRPEAHRSEAERSSAGRPGLDRPDIDRLKVDRLETDRLVLDRLEVDHLGATHVGRPGGGDTGRATAVGLARSAAAGDSVAVAAFQRGGWALGLGVVAAAAVCDLDLVVVGGGVAQVGELLLAPLRRTVAAHAGLSYLAALRVVPATLGTRAGLVGAAALAFHTL